ncbi:WD40 repeat domain-containing serine/threonine protein kinase [Nocardiopsis potens]|uniref:WD40 repeat domain-containing serine/threonine protein kinase n=1 Tax=Nocardiopsis potens TaxID=1246458 RepID=UPI00034973DD|nr:WD40 repeat domain-containing serine/threonine protein kinase [Nocardiopsis potens]
MYELRPDAPRELGGYTLLRRIGAGGMGVVYLGVPAGGGEPAAVKAVRPEYAEDTEFRARFAGEAELARRVRGPYTARVLGADTEGPTPWLATEYVPGPGLDRAVRDGGPFPEDSLRVLAAGLAEALSAIHSVGLVHRDLKPSNVLLSPRGPQVIDFGISRAVDATSFTRTGQTLGTPGYMSPEQATGADLDHRGDVFSYGGVLVFAATGRQPFGTGDPAALLYRVVNEEPDLSGVPDGLRGLVASCLAKDPADRPGLDAVLAGLGAAPLPGSDEEAATAWLPDAVATQVIRTAATLVELAPTLAQTTLARTAALPAEPAPTDERPVEKESAGAEELREENGPEEQRDSTGQDVARQNADGPDGLPSPAPTTAPEAAADPAPAAAPSAADEAEAFAPAGLPPWPLQPPARQKKPERPDGNGAPKEESEEPEDPEEPEAPRQEEPEEAGPEPESENGSGPAGSAPAGTPSSPAPAPTTADRSGDASPAPKAPPGKGASAVPRAGAPASSAPAPGRSAPKGDASWQRLVGWAVIAMSLVISGVMVARNLPEEVLYEGDVTWQQREGAPGGSGSHTSGEAPLVTHDIALLDGVGGFAANTSDGLYLFSSGPGSSTEKYDVQVLTEADRYYRHRITASRDGTAVALSARGRKDGSGGDSAGDTLHVWRTDGPGKNSIAPVGASPEVLGTALSPNGEVLFAILEDDHGRTEVRAFGALDGAELFTVEAPGAQALAVSPSGMDLAVSGDRGITVLSTATGEERDLPALEDSPRGLGTALAFGPNSKVAAASQSTVQVWSIDAGGPPEELPGLAAEEPASAPPEVAGLEFSDGGSKIAAWGTEEGLPFVRTWRSDGGEPIDEERGDTSYEVFALSPGLSRAIASEEIGGVGETKFFLRLHDDFSVAGEIPLPSSETP